MIFDIHPFPNQELRSQTQSGLRPNRANRASGLLGLGSGDRLLGSVRSRCISDCSVSVSVQPSRGILCSVSVRPNRDRADQCSVRLVLLGALVTYGNDLPRLSATLSSVVQGGDHEVTEGVCGVELKAEARQFR